MKNYRRQIAVVPQTVKIFNGTILENIILGREITNNGLIEKRIKQLGLASVIERFEAGLFTLIGEEGRDLSSGETQMLCIIRALLEEPEVLILDEGISAIDVEIENFIFSVLRNYANRHAVFIISHNLRTIYKTDYAYILHNKQIHHHGTPQELLRKNARFRNLWLTQQGNGILTAEVKARDRAKKKL